jgi:DHA1 family bicyclomycin/chloramphenicol resistance-like MFS transporter
VNRAWLILILGTLSAFGIASIDLYLPALPELAEAFGTGASQVQLTLTACLVGMALGQLVVGSLSDRFGRRRPLLVGLACFVAASFLCAAAPSIYALVALRFAQGFAAAAGASIARAIVRDLFEGAQIAQFLARLMLISGLAPILAPLVGGQLLQVTSWRGLFVVLGFGGAAVFAGVAIGLRETLPPERRRAGGFHQIRRAMGELVTDRLFAGYLLTYGCSFAGLFAYLAGSPFVLQEIHGVSPQAYGLMFGLNGIGIVIVSQTGAALGRRVSPRRLLWCGIAISNVGAALVLASVVADLGLVGIAAGLFVFVSSMGLIQPNATGLALAEHPNVAGTASALVGVFQYTIAAATAPIVGIAGKESAYPMAIVICVVAGCSVAALSGLARPRASAKIAA